MKKLDKRDIQSISAIREVIGCILQDPTLLDNHAVDIDDFVEPFHRLVFLAVNNLYMTGTKKMDSADQRAY